MIPDTSERVRKSSDAPALVKLSRMLRSMLRRFPRARLLTPQGAFGVLLDDNIYMQVSFTGRWTAEDMRDCLALFATWCVADPARIMTSGVALAGVSQMVELESAQSSGQPT